MQTPSDAPKSNPLASLVVFIQEKFSGRSREVEVARPRATLSVKLNGNLKHPPIELFAKRGDAATEATTLGPPWVPVTYACGYMLTNGWCFRDANGPLQTFCPVTIEQLDTITPLITRLKLEEVPAKELPRKITAALQPLADSMSQAAFESLCYYTFMRIGYPLPTGEKEDWLTIPPWALRLPTRTKKLN